MGSLQNSLAQRGIWYLKSGPVYVLKEPDLTPVQIYHYSLCQELLCILNLVKVKLYKLWLSI
jgi:hypothetical protein